MKNFRFFLRAICIACWFILPLAASAEELPDPRTLTSIPLKFVVPQAERVLLDNGMVVYMMEDHELPQISISALIGTGSVYEPESKVGLAGLAGAVMRSGGTTSISPEKMDDELEFMASTIESGIGADVGNVTMSTLTRNLDRTLQLFSQVLMAPAFREDKVELAQKHTIESLRRQNDDPKGIADRELGKAIYRGTPLGRVPTFATVRAITRDDMVGFHKKYYHPNKVILSVAGDFNVREMAAALNRVFAGWKRGPVEFPSIKEPGTEFRPEVLHAQKDVNQSVIRMGHIGIVKDNPDMYAIRVMDAILGSGGFNSRLMAEVRNSQGLAYNVESSFEIGRRYLGTFTAETETKAESTARTIALMEEIIAGMTKKPVTDQELQLAKDSIINSFIFGFTSTATVVNQKARLEYYRYPAGYLENYRDNLARVTKEDVLRVARKYLHPEALKLVVVGDAKRLDKPLSTFGKVEEIRLEKEE
ncbi:MAG TPA: pitrilysin family protein [Geobacteraceae bacterium]|nr:pitrilysin family protein [Geobacteraceae bacterium]